MDVLQTDEGNGRSTKVENTVRELTRKVVALEVNEAVLSRKYTAAVENADAERSRKKAIEEGEQQEKVINIIII